MKYLVSIILLMALIVIVQLQQLAPFLILQETPTAIQKSQKVFSVACGQIWIILGAIHSYNGAPLFGLKNEPTIEMYVKCPTDNKSMNVTFESSLCGHKYKGFKENPIMFNIEPNKTNSSQVRMKRVSSCNDKSIEIDSAYIGYVDKDIWYLVDTEDYSSTKEEVKKKFRFIVFGRAFDQDNRKIPLIRALNDISTHFFDSALKDFIWYKDFDTTSQCDLDSCYDPVIPKKTTTTRDEIPWKDRKIHSFLIILVVIAILMLGIIIFCGTRTSNFI